MSTLTITFLIYLFTRVDAIITLLAIISIGSSIAIIAIWAVSYGVQGGSRQGQNNIPEDSVIAFRTRCVWHLRWTIPLIFVFAMTPNQKDLVLIVGGALGYEAVSTVVADERVQETGGKAYEALNRWLDEVAEETED